MRVVGTVADAAVGKLGGSTSAAAAGFDKMGDAFVNSAKRSVAAGGEMQQMLLNIEAAQRKAGSQTNAWHGPVSELGHSFSIAGTAEADMQSLGLAFARMPSATKPAEDALDKLGGHTTTNLDRVRLLSQEFGIRLPRALETALARMPFIATALGGIGTAAIGLGIAEVFFRAGDAAYEFLHKLNDVNAEVRKYQQESGKAANDKLFDDASIETAVDLLRDANREIDELARKRQAAGVDRTAGGLMQYAHMFINGPAATEGAFGVDAEAAGGDSAIYNATDDARAAQAAANSDKARSRINDQGRKDDEERLRNRQQAQQQELLGINQISAERANAYALAKKLQDDQQAHERDLVETTSQQLEAELKSGKVDAAHLTEVHQVDPNAGLAERRIAEQKADEDAAAKSSVFTRKERDERIAAQDAAVNSGLEGDARYDAQRSQAIDALTRKYQQGELSRAGYAAIRASTEEKFDNEAAERLQKQIDSSQKMLRDAQSSGLTGVARVQAEHGSKIDNINTDRTLDPQAASRQREAAAVEANQKISEIEEQFAERSRALTDARTEASLSGYDKITAAAQRQVDELNRIYQKDFANAALSDEQKQQDAANLASAIKAINEGAAQQRTELAARNNAQDEQYAREAAQAEARVREQGLMGWTASYRDAIASIEEQEKQRVAKLAEEAQKEGLTWSEVAQRRADIERTASAQVAEQNEQLQHTLAGQLQSAFTDPTAFIKQKMQQMMFEVLADWAMQTQLFKTFFGTTLGGLHPGGATSSATGIAAPSGGATSASTGIAGLVAHSLGISAPTGTAGVISGGTKLPSSYSGTSTYGGVGSASSTDVGAGTSAGVDVSIPGASSVPTPASTGIGDITRVLGLSKQFQPTQSVEDYSPRASSPAGIPTAGRYSIGSEADASAQSDDDVTATQYGGGDNGFDGPSGPEAQASADADTALQGVGGGGLTAAAAQGLGLAAAGFGAYTGTEGVLSSFHQSGVKGALDGTMSGAEAGAAIGSIVPGIGTLVGGVIGGAVGLATNLVGDLMDEGGKFAARNYYKQTLFPELEALRKSGSTGDYTSTLTQVNQDGAQGLSYMKAKFGAEAANWVNANYLQKEVTDVTTDILRQARDGQGLQRQASEFHTGTSASGITGFGDLSTSPNEGFAHMMLGEGVVKSSAMGAHGGAVANINSGADAAQMAAHYLEVAGSGGSRMSTPLSTNNHTHNYNAIDAKSFGTFLDGGGMQVINNSANKRTANYAGDGLDG